MDLTKILNGNDEINRRVAEGLDWIQQTLGEKEVDRRVSDQIALRGATMAETYNTISPGSVSDLFGWHLYNCYAYFNDPPNYDTNAGCRIMPTIASLGARAPLLQTVPGAANRLKEVARGNADFEKTLFELLVAASYAEAGWKPELLKATGVSKTPDIRGTIAGEDVFIECKRLSKNSEYFKVERARWDTLVQPLASFIATNRIPIILKIVFHTELSKLPDDFLATTLVGKLLLAVAGVIVDSSDVTVTLRPVDMAPLEKELKDVDVKSNGSRILSLLFGSYSPALGYRTLIAGKMNDEYPIFHESIKFAAGIVWACDAPRAIAGRARDIHHRLADALDQLPATSPGIVHIAIESYDEPIVERIRNQKITKTLNSLKHGRDLRLVHVHLLSFETPPDEAWAVEETVFSTSFAPGRGATASQHEHSPYRLRKNHVWTVEGTDSQFTPFRGFS
jgi:hypothetical protein